jgi:superoxide dismutase, Cu-Zn family
MRKTRLVLYTLVATLAGCASLPRDLTAHATLESRSASAATGRVSLVEHHGSVRAHVEIHGLAPGSEHGFHVHDKGDCSAPDASSAGGHFNPGGMVHGRAGTGPHHAGDLPSVVADAKGNVNATLVLTGVTLAAGAESIVGHAIVLHAKRDDYTTQPAGDAGPRIACGVITSP